MLSPAYSGKANLELVTALGGAPYVPFKRNTTGNGDGSPLWQKLWRIYQYHREEFLTHYHQRSNVESTMWMIKSKFGEHIRSKTDTAMVNELLCKVLCHNICVVIQSVYDTSNRTPFLGRIPIHTKKSRLEGFFGQSPLPPLSETFAILGGGFGVSLLAAIPWLRESPILYWGDLDAQGFQILSQLRSVFPHVHSLMMDEQTFQTFSPFHVEGTPCGVRQLPHLTPEEHGLFLHLSEQTLRLEQERISHAYVLEYIKRCF